MTIAKKMQDMAEHDETKNEISPKWNKTKSNSYLRHPLPSRNSEMALNGFELLSVPRYQTNQPTSHSEASNFLMIEFVDLY